MVEQLRGITLRITVDTNKRTEEVVREVESLGDLPEVTDAAVADLADLLGGTDGTA